MWITLEQSWVGLLSEMKGRLLETIENNFQEVQI